MAKAAAGAVLLSWQHPLEHPPRLRGPCSPEHQGRLNRGSHCHRRICLSPSGHYSGEGSQARLIVGLLVRRKIRVMGLRCACITAGSAAPRYGTSVTARGRGRGQQCPGGGSRDPAAATRSRAGAALRAGRDSQGPVCRGLWEEPGGSRGRGTRSHPAPQCQSWHGRARPGTSRECSPRRLFGSCPWVIRLALGWGWWKNLRIPAGMELSRGSCRGPRGVPYRSAVVPRGRVTLHTAATASPRIC